MSFLAQKNNLKIQSRKKKQESSRVLFSVTHFFRLYLRAMKSKALFFNYPSSTSKTMSDVLMCLEKNNRIAGYKFFPQEKSFRIFLTYDLAQKKNWIPQVIAYSSPCRTKVATCRQLQQFHTQNPHALTLIRTYHGIFDLKTCLLRQCGGEFLISLN